MRKLHSLAVPILCPTRATPLASSLASRLASRLASSLGTLLATLLTTLLAVLLAGTASGQFGRDVRPILSEYCFQCHGPDERGRKAKLRLDTKDGLLAHRKGHPPIVPGQPLASEVIRRVSSTDPKHRMPPPSTKRRLTPEQIEVLREWIRGGAKWENHWAFETPTPTEPPAVRDPTWAQGAIDRFVLARLESDGWTPNPPAAKRELLRRVTLDLTGLPPTPDELAAFVADSSPKAYEGVVERLLASPRYGERMAWDWLEAARYADTNGFQGDATRTMWPYRDWVVSALNRNLPYDKFLVWQLAGDQLREPSDEQRLATAFSRNHMINGEGGRIPEENRVEYVFDQVETVGTVWLGLTLTCARCHDHKFDPLSQRNYFELSAFFNQTPVTGAGGDPQTAPTLTVRSDADRQELERLESRANALAAELSQWAQTLAASPRVAIWAKQQRAGVFAALPATVAYSVAGQELQTQPDHSILASGKNPEKDTYTVQLPLPAGRYTAIRLDALQHESRTAGGLARSESGNFVLTGFEASLREGESPPRRIALDGAEASFEQKGFDVQHAIDGKPSTGWAVHQGGKVKDDHAAIFKFAAPLTTRGGTLEVTLRHDSEHANHNLVHFRLSISDATQPLLLDGELTLALAKPQAERTPQDAERVARAFAESDPTYVEVRQRHDAAQTALETLRTGSDHVKVMVMADRPERRKTYVLRRGTYRHRGAEVDAAVPEFLGGSLPTPRNRLALARWLTHPDHPLTSRVVVNRHWAKFFGIGLVETVEDFGSQGSKPSHPALLDWLATGFVHGGWNVKALHRQIVTSSTYRQAAAASPGQRQQDPANRKLARGPRYRLPSFMLRDTALAVSGLFVEQSGGPAVKPYQPDGVWADATFGKKRYAVGRGSDLYRRSLYTFWRRIVGPTMFFDVAKRQTCEVRAMRTNTPMHALLTLNGVGYVEAARGLAQRVLQRTDLDVRGRIALAFELTTSRNPRDDEIGILTRRLAILRQEYRERPEAATQLLAIGASTRDESIAPLVHAAWTGLCSLILNLDEALNK